MSWAIPRVNIKLQSSVGHEGRADLVGVISSLNQCRIFKTHCHASPECDAIIVVAEPGQDFAQCVCFFLFHR